MSLEFIRLIINSGNSLNSLSQLEKIQQFTTGKVCS